MVRIKVLGALTAQVAGAAVNLGGPRQRGVLAQLLVARGEAVPADRLIENLWRGAPPAKAAASLQAYVSNLRRLLEPARGPREPARLLVTEARGYALRTAATDAAEFERLLTAARAGSEESPEAALALWTGAPYAEFADEPWAAAETARLTELWLGARELAVARTLEAGRPAEAVPAARVLAEQFPLREEGWRLWALALWGSGRQAEALEALRGARAVLAEELGLDPGPALTELEAAILRGRTDLLGPAHPAPPSLHPTVPTPAAPTPTAPTPAPSPLPPVPAGPRRPRTGAAGGTPPLFVGREPELAVLREAAEAARSARSVVLVTGEAGAGKSTLLGRLRAELLDAGWLVASGRCPETEGAPPAWAWTEALRELAAQAPPGPGIAPELEPLFAEDDRAVRQDALAGRFQLHRAVRDWLATAARRAPVAVIVDDLHAADRETRALLAELLAARAVPGVLLVLAHRPGEGELTDLLAVLARQSPYRLPLAGLAEPEAGRLIGSICPDPVDADTVRALTERTGGNPFYLVESAQLLAGEGALVAVQEVPQGVRDVLRRRFDRLPAATVEALRLAAVAGRETEVELLLHAGDWGEDVLLDALESALAGGLLTEPGPGTVRFTHALVRDTLYADLSGLRRARLHGRIAAALRALRPDRLTALAHHYTRAASGTTAERAVEYCVRAAEAAMRRYAHETSAALFGQALDNLDRVPEGGDDRAARRIDLLGSLLNAQVRAGEVAAASATKAAAIKLAVETGREDLTIRAWTAWTEPTPWVTRAYGTFDQAAVDTLTRLLRRPGLPPVTRCRLLDALTYELDCSGDPLGWDVAGEAVAIARAEGDPRLLALALAAEARTHDHEQAVGLRTGVAEELGALAEAHDLPAYRWHAEHLASTVAAARGDLPEYRRRMEAAAAIAERYGLAELIDVGRCQRATLALAAGDTDLAERLYDEALTGLRARRSVHAEGYGALARVTIAMRRGTLAGELPLIRRMTGRYGAIVADMLALALIDDGREEEARRVWAERTEVRHDYYHSYFLVTRAMVAVALGAVDEAAVLIEQLRPLDGLVAGAGSTSIALRPVALSLGELAVLLGRGEEAAAAFARAAEVARRWESPGWEAEALAALHRLAPAG
ncbi:BTAD domain-containing putative transcriptional regulator [Kitasatospora camelliae]|uniref:BTAD domain-containing putative transcriptional regulator n=1 Tax=Kitasatospora camelliae TaxID=3156397 RepID=A0AAU8K0W4_9ACTN